MKLFPSKPQIFTPLESTATAKGATTDSIGSGPVSPEDYIDASGRCGAAAAGPADVAVGTMAGDLGTTTAVQQSAAPTTPGGVALGMTECQVAGHAGQPGQVNIGSGENSERKVVLTYLSGPWPGIYTFADGRLKEIERVAQPEPPKAVKKKGKSNRPATASAPPAQRVR